MGYTPRDSRLESGLDAGSETTRLSVTMASCTLNMLLEHDLAQADMESEACYSVVITRRATPGDMSWW